MLSPSQASSLHEDSKRVSSVPSQFDSKRVSSVPSQLPEDHTPPASKQAATADAPTPLAPAGPPKGPPGGPPPDGGLTAWLQVLSGYFLFFNTWGLVNAFGIFQTYYSGVLLTDKSNSAISWIGTFTSFLLCASPIALGPIYDRGLARVLVYIGSFAIVFGLMMTSLCTQYWQLLLAQGIVCGLGGGCLFITAVSILPSYFAKKRAFVMGAAASGSSLGGILYPIIFNRLINRVGFGWTVRVIGFIALATLIIPVLTVKPRGKPPAVRKTFDLRIIKEVPFEVFNFATFFGFMSQYIPYFFIEQYAAEHNIRYLAFYQLIFLNVGSLFGRLLPGIVADKYFHPLHVLTFTTGSSTILAFCWIAIQHSFAGLTIWCLLYGFFSGAFVSLQGPAVASMTKDFTTIGTRFGINMFFGAIGILIGSPVGGAIFPQSWPGAQSFCGAGLLLSTLCIISTKIVYEREQKQKTAAITADPEK